MPFVLCQITVAGSAAAAHDLLDDGTMMQRGASRTVRICHLQASEPWMRPGQMKTQNESSESYSDTDITEG